MINLSSLPYNTLDYKTCVLSNTNTNTNTNIVNNSNLNLTNNYINNNYTSNINYTAKRDFLFRFVQSNIRSYIKMDEESLYSTTDQLTADRISKDMLKFIPNTSTVTDATACIGGTAYSFSQHFHKVNAIEIDTQRFKLLTNNLNILLKDIDKHNVTCYNSDSLLICNNLQQNAIFIDPPWGGPDYKQNSKLSLYLSNIELSLVCRELYKYTDYIVIKVPTNFDEQVFIEKTCLFLQLVHKNTTLRKMHLLIFKCNNKL